MSLPIRVAAVQYATDNPERTRNQDLALHLMDDAAHIADIVLLPELSFGNLPDMGNAIDTAEPVPGPLTAIVSQIAVTRNCYICFSIPERQGDQVCITAVLASADGHVVGTQRKHTISSRERQLGIQPGDAWNTFSTHLGSIGILFKDDCGDATNIEAFVRAGAQLLLVPASIDSAGQDVGSASAQWRHSLARLAQSSGCFIVHANKIGGRTDALRIGGSMIIAPDGHHLSQGSADREEVVRAEIDLAPAGSSTRFRAA